VRGTLQNETLLYCIFLGSLEESFGVGE
jgi:hypothetical protein